MIKYLLLSLILSATIWGEVNFSTYYTINSTQVDSFANLGENVNDLFIDPEIEGRLVAVANNLSGLGSGVKISKDNGVTWESSTINTSFSRYLYCNSLAFSLDNLDNGFLAVGFDHLFKTTDRGETWDSTNMFTDYENINHVYFHPLNSNIVFVSNGSVNNLNEVLLYKSIDGGLNWTVSDSTNFKKLVFHPDSTNIIYGISRQYTIKKTTNGGETWEKINNNLVASYVITALKQSRINPNTLYCGQYYDYSNDTWLLSMTTNGGESWVRIDSTLKAINPEGSVYSILLDQNVEGKFYVSYTGGLFLTEDNGKHYQNIYSGTTGKIWSDNKNPPNIYFNSDEGLLRIFDTLTVGVRKNVNNIPTQYKLNQNYPNPFNPSTTIKFELSKESHVLITIYNSLGEKVTEVVNKIMNAGKHEVNFNTLSASRRLSSGMYFYSIVAGEFRATKKMILLK